VAQLVNPSRRTHALHKHRPISLYATIHPPSLDEAPSDRSIASGLELLIKLYKPIDDTFVQLWNKARPSTTPTNFATMQNHLSETLPTYLDCTESQAVDLQVTQQWLRTMVWQLCVSQGLVSSVAANSAMTFKYPIEIARDLLSMTQQFSQHAMEVLGVGLVSLLIPSQPLYQLPGPRAQPYPHIAPIYLDAQDCICAPGRISCS
jgi:hypothetical protein